MQAGDLRYKISVLQPSIVKDTYGATSETYVLHMALKAGKKEVSGTKLVDGNQEIFNTNRIDWSIYYRPSITSNMLISYNEKKYKILYIQEIGFKSGMIIQTELINT